MIVKIQVALFSSDGNLGQALIYDETREFMYQTETQEEFAPIKKLMGDEPKKFFHAEVIDSQFVIGDEAEWQDW